MCGVCASYAIKYRQARVSTVAGLKLWMAVWVPDGGRGEFDWVRITCDAAVAGLQFARRVGDRAGGKSGKGMGGDPGNSNKRASNTKRDGRSPSSVLAITHPLLPKSL